MLILAEQTLTHLPAESATYAPEKGFPWLDDEAKELVVSPRTFQSGLFLYLFFLSFVARQGSIVDEYRDEAVGLMEKDEQGRLVMSKVILRPRSIYTGNSPDGEAEEALNHPAHQEGFIGEAYHGNVRRRP